MIQNSEVLTEEANRVALVSTRRGATQGGYLSIIEGQIPMNGTEQIWTFEVAKKTPANTITSGQVNPVRRAVEWLNHLASGRIDESRLQATHNVHHSVRINGIGL